MDTKACNCCGEEKPLTDFASRQAMCKVCQRAANAAYKAEHAERLRAERKAKYAADPETAKAKAQAYRRANPDRVRATNRAYQEKNVDRLRALRKQKYAADPAAGRARTQQYQRTNRERYLERTRVAYWQNKESYNAASRRYYEAHKEEILARNRAYKQQNPEANRMRANRRRDRKQDGGGSYTAAEWEALCNYYGNRCLCCGATGVPLSPDHVLPIAKGGTSYISNIQPLCWPCNRRKKDRHIDYRP